MKKYIISFMLLVLLVSSCSFNSTIKQGEDNHNENSPNTDTTGAHTLSNPNQTPEKGVGLELVGTNGEKCYLSLGMDYTTVNELFDGLNLSGKTEELFNITVWDVYHLVNQLEYKNDELSCKLYGIYVMTPEIVAPNGKKVGDIITQDDTKDTNAKYPKSFRSDDGNVCYEYDKSDYYFLMKVNQNNKLISWGYSYSSLADISEYQLDETKTKLTATFQNGKVLTFHVGMSQKELIEYMNENRISYLFAPLSEDVAGSSKTDTKERWMGYQSTLIDYVFFDKVNIQFSCDTSDISNKIISFHPNE